MANVKGKGSTIGFNAGSGATVVIGQVVSISGPSASVGTVESTNLASTARTFLTTIPDMGEVSFTVNWDHDLNTQSGLETILKTPDDTVAWLITLSDATTIGFDGLLTGFNITGMEIDGLVQAEITVKVTGDITIT